MYAEAAKTVDASSSAELLISIFTPGGPLHDGAAIIRGNRIVAAGAFLPLTTSRRSEARARNASSRRDRAHPRTATRWSSSISEENGSIAAATEGVAARDTSIAISSCS